MSDEAFATLKAAMENAFAFEHGQRRDLRVTRIQSAAPKAMSPKEGLQMSFSPNHHY